MEEIEIRTKCVKSIRESDLDRLRSLLIQHPNISNDKGLLTNWIPCAMDADISIIEFLAA